MTLVDVLLVLALIAAAAVTGVRIGLALGRHVWGKHL